MKKHLLLLSLALSAVLPAASSLAADMEEQLPPPPPPVEQLRPATYDWTGAYVGGWAGTTCIDGVFTNANANPSPEYLNAGCGFKGGVLAGYNQQMEDIVFGVEADWGKTGNIATNPTPGANTKFKMDGVATARARLGVAFDDTLLFATAGGAFAYGNLTDNYSTAPKSLYGQHWGWSVGAGVEHAFTDQLRLKLDYLYTKFKDDDYADTCCNLHGGPGSDHEVRLGAIWAF